MCKTAWEPIICRVDEKGVNFHVRRVFLVTKWHLCFFFLCLFTLKSFGHFVGICFFFITLSESDNFESFPSIRGETIRF